MDCFDLNTLILENSIYYTSKEVSVSYPEEGYNDCFAVEDNSFWFKHRNRIIAYFVKKYAHVSTFCDIGGGNGFVSSGLQSEGINTILIEPGKAGCMNASARGVKNIVCGTLQDSGISDSCLQSAGIFDVLEHIEHDIEFLAAINKKMAPKAKLFITVPAYEFLWSYEDDYTGHYRRYTLNSLRSTAERAGFVSVQSTYIFSLLPVPIFLSRVLASKKSSTKPDNSAHKRSFISRFVNWILRFELKLLSIGIKIPFGSTCFIVLEKK